MTIKFTCIVKFGNILEVSKIKYYYLSITIYKGNSSFLSTFHFPILLLIIILKIIYFIIIIFNFFILFFLF